MCGTFAFEKDWSQYDDIVIDGEMPLNKYMLSCAKKLDSQYHDDGYIFKAYMPCTSVSIKDLMSQVDGLYIKKVIVLPMFPQYSSATNPTALDKVSSYIKQLKYIPEFHYVNHYCDHPSYIAAISNQIKNFYERNVSDYHLLFSFHGMPSSRWKAGDPYSCFCHKTVRLVTSHLGIDSQTYSISFQSKFGYADWLKPDTVSKLKELAASGIKKVVVIAPGFSCDCLETLFEIKHELSEDFKSFGGDELAIFLV